MFCACTGTLKVPVVNTGLSIIAEELSIIYLEPQIQHDMKEETNNDEFILLFDL